MKQLTWFAPVSPHTIFRITALALLVLLVASPSGAQDKSASSQESRGPDDPQLLAPAIVAALITAGVLVAGGVVAWINDQSDDVSVQNVAVATSDVVPSHCGTTVDQCTDVGFYSAQCEAFVNNACGYARASGYADSPFIGSDYLIPYASGFTKSPHGAYAPELHDIHAESNIVVNKTTRSSRAGAAAPAAASLNPNLVDGAVMATISVDSFKVQVRNGSPKTATWDINYVATPAGGSPVDVLHSSGVLHGDGTVDVTGDIPSGQLVPYLDGGGVWTIELYGYTAEQQVGFIDVGEQLDVTMNANASMAANDAEANSAGVPTLSEWGMIALAVLMMGLGLFYVRRRSFAASPAA